MQHATETYKERLIKRIESIKDTDCDSEWNQAMQTVIIMIQSNDIPDVVQQPHEVPVAAYPKVKEY